MNDSNVKKELCVFLQHHNDKIMDIGAFLWQLDKVRKLPIDYDVLLKIHTKSDPSWRRKMITPFVKDITSAVKYVQTESSIIGESAYHNYEFRESEFLRNMEKDVFGRISAEVFS